MKRLFRSVRDERGAVLIESAFSLPLVLLVMLGGFETSQFVLANQKLSRIAATMSDTIAQSSQTLTRRQMSDLLNSVNFMSSPFNMATNGRVIITALEGDAGVNKVLWRRCAGGISATSTLGAPASLPGGAVLPEGSTAVVAEAFVDYVPVFRTGQFQSTRLRQVSLFRTRVGALPVAGPVDDGSPVSGALAVSTSCG